MSGTMDVPSILSAEIAYAVSVRVIVAPRNAKSSPL
jgi:hypothetical protein